jgi:hypothetical protein
MWYCHHVTDFALWKWNCHIVSPRDYLRNTVLASRKPSLAQSIPASTQIDKSSLLVGALLWDEPSSHHILVPLICTLTCGIPASLIRTWFSRDCASFHGSQGWGAALTRPVTGIWIKWISVCVPQSSCVSSCEKWQEPLLCLVLGFVLLWWWVVCFVFWWYLGMNFGPCTYWAGTLPLEPCLPSYFSSQHVCSLFF